MLTSLLPLPPSFQPPDDFDTPFDMRNYPQHFSKEFIAYFFAVEVRGSCTLTRTVPVVGACT